MTHPFAQPVNPDAQENLRQAQDQFIKDFHDSHRQKVLAIFNSAEGDALLNFWDDMFLRQPVIVPNDPAGVNEMREGRNAFIRSIRMMVNAARGPQSV